MTNHFAGRPYYKKRIYKDEKTLPGALWISKPQARLLHAGVPCNYIHGRSCGRTPECF